MLLHFLWVKNTEEEVVGESNLKRTWLYLGQCAVSVKLIDYFSLQLKRQVSMLVDSFLDYSCAQLMRHYQLLALKALDRSS